MENFEGFDFQFTSHFELDFVDGRMYPVSDIRVDYCCNHLVLLLPDEGVDFRGGMRNPTEKHGTLTLLGATHSSPNALRQRLLRIILTRVIGQTNRT